MSDASTKRMIEMYMQESTAPMFLSGFFESPPDAFHNSEKVELDIERDDEDIAVVIQDLSVDGRENEASKYTNKEFAPPIFKEVGTLNAFEMIKRRAGENPFADPNFGAAATKESFKLFRKLEKKIRRSIELMASQVLQTGTLTLKDSAGVNLYTLDFKPKATHIVTVGTTWATDGSTGDPLTDIASLAKVVRRDGKGQPFRLVCGESALQRLLANSDVQLRLDNRGMNIGEIAPETRGEGATFYGHLWVGNYRFELWSYDGFYKDPQTGLYVPYVDDDKIVMLSKNTKLKLSYGAIPRIVSPESRVLPFLPTRMSSGARGLDLTPNAWLTPNGSNLKVEVGTRPLTIPTAIDTFACLDVTA